MRTPEQRKEEARLLYYTAKTAGISIESLCTEALCVNTVTLLLWRRDESHAPKVSEAYFCRTLRKILADLLDQGVLPPPEGPSRDRMRVATEKFLTEVEHLYDDDCGIPSEE